MESLSNTIDGNTNAVIGSRACLAASRIGVVSQRAMTDVRPLSSRLSISLHPHALVMSSKHEGRFFETLYSVSVAIFSLRTFL